MSTLINHFCSFSLSPISPTVPNSLAVHLRTAWMRHAMVDPCLFHSTLFSASAHIDNLRDSAESPRTTYHSMQTVRLLRQKLDDHNSRGRYEVAGAVLALALFNMRLDRPEIALTHRRGLMNMLEFLKGDGTHLTELVALIKVMLLVFSMIIPPDRECPLSRSYAETYLAPYPPSLAPRPSDLLESTLRRDTDANIPATLTVATGALIQDIFYHIAADFHGMVHNAQVSTTPSHPHLAASSSHAAENPSLTIEEEPQSNTTTRDINLCLQSAASIFRSMLATSQQPQPQPQQHPISAPATPATQSKESIPKASLIRLQKLLRKVGFPSWLQHAPEAYLWICLTAAASAADLTLRGGFIMMSMPVLLALETTELAVTRQTWVYFMWLEQARGVGPRGPGAGTGVGVVKADGSGSGVSELS
ncbi:hypothetical protein BJY01DRAFT_256308 [Aspergillus pseudoustus]|uniref:Uncharacterized protein n=1 Tax=Aspergillus pseudoustus TaxID=1810923 RepID=A0ABR4IC01_9EURO